MGGSVKSKFLAVAIMVAGTAFLSMGSMSQPADAGLFGNRGGILGLGLFNDCGGGGLQSYSSCGGGGLQNAYASCGGGGLQAAYGAYSSCGGGGGGLQFAPQAYYPAPQVYSAPVSYYGGGGFQSYDSSCPGGVCPPPMGGGLSMGYQRFAPTVVYSAPRVVQPTVVYHRPAPVRTYAAPMIARTVPPVPLNPGETYVAGSLRQVPARPAQAVARNVPERTRQAAPPERPAPETARTPARATNPLQGTPQGLPEGVLVYQLGYEGCVHCENDARIFEEQGIEVIKVDIKKDPTKTANLWRDSDIDLSGYPAYVMTYNGKHVQSSVGSFGNHADVKEMVLYAHDRAEEIDNPVAKKRDESDAPTQNDRIELVLLELLNENRKTREAIEGFVKTAAR